jgi:dienelactone hydrolase
MSRRIAQLFCSFLLATGFGVASAPTLADAPQIGIVVMHGKGGAPNKFVNVLADGLTAKGLLVANIEMSWSKSREYDVPADQAVEEIKAALAGLKAKGAKKLFVAGHSLGGTFAVYFGGVHPIDGIIGIAPGGSSANPTVARAIAPGLAKARELIAEGKGKERAELIDYEPSKGGAYPINSVPEAYVSFFDPNGIMNSSRTAPQVKAPVLWGVATRDYPGLRKVSPPLFKEFPAHPLNKYFEPEADHLNAPGASVDEIVAWTAAVAASR